MINTLLPREKEHQSKTFSICLTLELRTLGVLELHPGVNAASFACFLAKRACMKKKKEKKKEMADMFPMSCLKNTLAFKNSFMIYNMGFEGYLIGCWFCVLCCQRCLLVIAVSSLPAYVYLSQYLPSHFCPPDHRIRWDRS